jgi:hypothetical protein
VMRVQVDAAVKAVLARVESHRVSPSARKARLLRPARRLLTASSAQEEDPMRIKRVQPTRPSVVPIVAGGCLAA